MIITELYQYTMKIRTLVFHVLLVSALTISVHAQSAGKTGLSFLKIGAGARNIALGDNGTVFANDAASVFYNPANLLYCKSDEVLLMHNSWIQDVSSEIIAAKITIGGLPIGIGVNSTSVKDIEIRNRPGAAEGTFNAQYFMGSLSTAFSVYQNISAGVTCKYLYEGMFSEAANGYGLDLGVSWKHVYQNISVAAAIKNMGSMDELGDVKTKLPTELRLGAYYPIGDVGNAITVTTGVELQKYTGYDDAHLNLGVEAGYDNMLYVRAGYMTMYEAKSVTTGLGVQWKNVDVDYAMTPFSTDLGTAHSFSVKIGF